VPDGLGLGLWPDLPGLGLGLWPDLPGLGLGLWPDVLGLGPLSEVLGLGLVPLLGVLVLGLVPLLGVLMLGLVPLPEVLGLGLVPLSEVLGLGLVPLLGVLEPELDPLLGVLELELELDPLFDVPELGLDPLPDGEPVGVGPTLLVGGGVMRGGDEGEPPEVIGCGCVGVADGEVGCACGAGGADALAGEVVHCGTGADIRAIVGSSGLVASAWCGSGLIMAACLARGGAAAIPRLPAGSVEGDVGEGVSDAHCEPRFEPSGVGEDGTAERLGSSDGPEPEAPGEGAGCPAGTPLPSVLGPSTLSAWPPVSTLELACTTACRSGATASVAETTNATAASTPAGRNQPRPPAPRSAVRNAAESSGTAARRVTARTERSRGTGTRSRDTDTSPRRREEREGQAQ
jgi:hypothetical protein